MTVLPERLEEWQRWKRRLEKLPPSSFSFVFEMYLRQIDSVF